MGTHMLSRRGRGTTKTVFDFFDVFYEQNLFLHELGLDGWGMITSKGYAITWNKNTMPKGFTTLEDFYTRIGEPAGTILFTFNHFGTVEAVPSPGFTTQEIITAATFCHIDLMPF